MAAEEAVRWNIEVSKETDLALRSFLALEGIEQSGRANFIEQAVLRQLLHRTVQDIHTRNRFAEPEQIEAEIEAAVREVRAEARVRNSSDNQAD